MRESNNLVLGQVKSEGKNIVSKNEIISQKTQSNLNSQEILKETKDNVSFDIELEKKSSLDGSQKTVNSNLFKKNSTNPNSKNQKTKLNKIQFV